MATKLTRMRGARATHNRPKMGPDFNAGGRTGAPPYLNTPEPSAWTSAPRRGKCRTIAALRATQSYLDPRANE